MIIIIGCGRSGTLYTHRCLTRAGLDFGHERLGMDGGVGWPLALGIEAVGYSKGQTFAPYTSTAKRLHQVREPIACLRTLRGHGNRIWSNVSKITGKLAGENNPLLRAMQYWYRYNAACAPMAEYSYDVADLGVVGSTSRKMVSWSLNVPEETWDNTSSSVNHHAPPSPLSIDELMIVDDELCVKILESWKKFKVTQKWPVLY